MKTIIIGGTAIGYDETLVHMFLSDSEVRVERVSCFNKWSQMPAYKLDPEMVRLAIESESRAEQAADRWKHSKTTPFRYMRSVFPYDPNEVYQISLTGGMFRYVGEKEMAPHMFRFNTSYFYQIVKSAGLEASTGGSSHSGSGTLIELAEQVKKWHQIGFLRKSDWIEITGRYVGDGFTTRVGTLLGFGYAGDKNRYWNKWFRV